MNWVLRPGKVLASVRLLGLAALAVGCLMGGCVDQPAAGVVNALDVCLQSADGALCNDNLPCTVNDVCAGGRCVGTQVADHTPCTDGNVCTTGDQCLAAVCLGTVLADGMPCSDDDACTSLDVCQMGRCQPGAPTVCDDGDSCTLDMCLPSVGCVFSSRDCAAPQDAAPDATPDVLIGIDASGDGPGTGPDGAQALDGADMPDTSTDVGQPDAVVPDAAVAVDGRPAPDAGQDAGTDVDARPDAGDVDAGSSDGRDASGDLQETPPDLRARGGGCNCRVAQGPGGARQAFAVLALVLALLWGRRKRAPRGRDLAAGARRR